MDPARSLHSGARDGSGARILSRAADFRYVTTQEQPATVQHPSVPAGNPLIAKAKRGDRHALEQLIRHYQNPIARFVISLTNETDFEDLCQAIFVRMVLALPRLRNLDRFEPWLFQIARNICRDHLRHQKIQRKRFIPYRADEHDELVSRSNPSVDECVGASDGSLDAAITRLPAAQRTLLQLWITDGASYQELARQTHSSVAVVKSALFRARQNLRIALLGGETK